MLQHFLLCPTLGSRGLGKSLLCAAETLGHSFACDLTLMIFLLL